MSDAFVIQYHNEHAAEDDQIFGPYTLEEAKQQLAELVRMSNDSLFKDRTYVYVNTSLGCAGYDEDELDEAERDTDLASEIWAEIRPITRQLLP